MKYIPYLMYMKRVMKMMKSKWLWILAFTVLVVSNGCSMREEDGTLNNFYPIIPKPMKLVEKNGQFVFSPKTKVLYFPDSDEIKGIADYFVEMLHRSGGLNIKVKPVSTPVSSKNSLLMVLDTTLNLEPEGYVLNIKSGKIEIRAKESSGLFYAIQTLRQLLPPQIESAINLENLVFKVPCAEIIDQPRFSYRGLHLDVARHFFPKDSIFRFLDLMAFYKYNTFHFHLTDDQGWRIEIKKYPKLTSVGAWRKETQIDDGINNPDTPIKYDGKRYGGYYTQDDIREIVAYAKKLNINIIPEIEMPGHAVAALASYPYLGCTGDTIEVSPRWWLHYDIFCAGKESTFKFLEDVLNEVMELFPSKYIHIGGDEVPKDRWEKCSNCQARIKAEGLKDEKDLQTYFIARIEKFLNAHGRRIIAWDDILEGGYRSDAVVMPWHGDGSEGAKSAVELGHDVIMTPASYCYFDFYQGEMEKEPLANDCGITSLGKVYSFEPIPKDMCINERQHILGAQANLWTEDIPTMSHVEYMEYPRACALAEVLWTKEDEKDYKDFLNRLSVNLEHLRILKVNFRELDK